MDRTIAISKFATRVYNCVAQVPAGKVTSYAAIARAVDCASPRAVGQILRKNPFAPEVPCHRIIATDGTLGGFFGAERRFNDKLTLLASERVHFDQDGKLLDENCWFDEADFSSNTGIL